MTYLFEQINHIATIIAVIVYVFIFVAVVFVIWNKKFRKQKRLKDYEVDYSNFNRKDSKDYIKMEDIKNDMIYLDHGMRFVGAIQCQGYDFFSAHPTEQASTANNYGGFINTINKPITYRQYGSAIDLEETQIKYQGAYEELYQLFLQTKEELSSLLNIEKSHTLSEEERMEIEREIEIYKNRLEAYEFRLYHLEDQMEYMNLISGESVMPEINETYVFDWIFDPMDFSVDLTAEEIEQRAIQELNAIASAKINVLSSCGVKARRLKTEELIDCYRRFSAPISADRYKIKDVLNSSFFSDIVTSTSISDIIKEGIETASVESENFLNGLFGNEFETLNAYYEEQLRLVEEEAAEQELILLEKK